MQRTHVLTVVAPLRRLEATAIGVLLDGLEAATLGLRQRAPPAVARRLEIERAGLAQGVAHTHRGGLVLHECDDDGLAASQRILDDEDVVPRDTLRQRVLERVADGRAAGAEEGGAQQAEGDDRSDARNGETHRRADRQADARAGGHAGHRADRRAGARRLALVDRHRRESTAVGARGQQREMVARDAQRREALHGALRGVP